MGARDGFDVQFAGAGVSPRLTGVAIQDANPRAIGTGE
jgi:hypothetical protein